MSKIYLSITSLITPVLLLVHEIVQTANCVHSIMQIWVIVHIKCQKSDLTDFESRMGARWAGLSISKTPDMRFSLITVSHSLVDLCFSHFRETLETVENPRR